MTEPTPYEQLRDGLQRELAEPGPVTKDELRLLLKRSDPPVPPPALPDGDFAADDFDPADFG